MADHDVAPYRLANSRGWPTVEVVGESFHTNAIISAIGRRPKLDEEVEIETTAALVPEPDNPHDKNAISVRIQGQTVGYLEKPLARLYKASIHRVAASGYEATTTARVWATTRESWDGKKKQFNSNVRLALAEPHLTLPVNDPPSQPHSVIPWGSGLQVTGEEEHLDRLAPLLPRDGRGLLIVTLHHANSHNAKGTVTEFAEVRVDGLRVGQMTPATSRHYLPTIDHLAGKGLTAAAWAYIKGSSLAVEVVLQAAKASELDQSWLTGPATPVLRLVAEALAYEVPDAYEGRNESSPDDRGGSRGDRPGGGLAAGRTESAKPSAQTKPQAGCAAMAAIIVASGALSFTSPGGPAVGTLAFAICTGLVWLGSRWTWPRRGKVSQ